MGGQQEIRASDADRQRVADALRRHAADGRLTLDELSERLGEVYAAKTLGQLAGPASPMRELPPLMPPLTAPKGWGPGPWAPPVAPPPPGTAAPHRSWLMAPQVWIIGVIVLLMTAALAQPGEHGGGGVILLWILFFVGLRFFKRSVWSGSRRRSRSRHPW